MSRNRGGQPRRHTSPIAFEAEDNEPEPVDLVADHRVYFSADGRRRHEELHNISHKKRLFPNEAYNRDEAADTSPPTDPDLSSGKRKMYASSDELLRHNSLGDNTEDPCCGICTRSYDATYVSDPAVDPIPRLVKRIFKCRTCGAFLQCEGCCLTEHARQPLHVIEHLGLVFQLGHGGLPCVCPNGKINLMTVLDAPYVHEVHFQYCKCSRLDYANNLQQLLRNSWYPATVTSPGTCTTFETLEMYRLMNVIGNMNAYDFIKTLERVTNTTASTGLDWLPGMGSILPASGEQSCENWRLSAGPARTMAQEDVLEDKIDSHKFLKNIGQGDTLQWKLVVALAEQEQQIAAFKACSRTVEHDVQKLWQADIDAWLANKRKPNPYTLPHGDYPTEAETRLELKKEKTAEAAAGRPQIQGTSAVAFLVAGLQLEDAQRRIIVEVKGTRLVATDCQGKIEERCATFFKKLAIFRHLQLVFMPGAKAILEVEEGLRNVDAAPIAAEAVKLWMPHKVPDSTCSIVCVVGLCGTETRLRVAQCQNALSTLRTRLHAKRHFISYRNANVAGQVQSTKVATLIGQIGERVDMAAAKYRKGRDALVALNGGEAHVPQFRELHADDIRLNGDWGESDGAARKKLAMIGAGRGLAHRGTSRGHRNGALDELEQHLHALHVEWEARKTHWVEEVMLLQEEMKRVLRYLTWEAVWWEGWGELRTGVNSAMQSGLRGYAAKQAQLHRLGYAGGGDDAAPTAVDLDANSEDGLHLDQLFTPLVAP
ncbi:hypothetical protein C8J57DRAFT_1259097 [Mycena rebaudengoi]|nr:hypothetical protein C8J57DRAFT_1259097 [Mycena rebaudengoi]